MYWNPLNVYIEQTTKEFKELLIKNKDKIIQLKNEAGPFFDIYPERTLIGHAIVVLTKNYKCTYTSKWSKTKIINGFNVEKIKIEDREVYDFEGNVLRTLNRLKRYSFYPLLNIRIISYYELLIETEIDLIEAIEKEEIC